MRRVLFLLFLVACAPARTIVVYEEVEVSEVNKVFLPLTVSNSRELSCETLTDTVWVTKADITEQYQVVDCLNVYYRPVTIEHTDIVEIWGQWGMMTDMQVLVWGDGPFVINLRRE